MQIIIGNPVGEVEPNSLIQADCLDVMQSIPDASVDMILCDLPYGTTACKWDTVIPFEPNGKPDNGKAFTPRTVPKMTAGRAALVVLMNRYLSGLLDPFVSLLEVHKLLYFMQEAGQPLKLRYKKATYGPYAENLRHVLHAVEGHMVSSYRDEDAPHTRLELVPGAVSDAEAFLQDDATTREHFDRVAELVDGFESPFGLELLATVHWVVTREHAASVDDVIARTYAWGERKREFTSRQIGLAAGTLRDRGWLDGSHSLTSA